ncbi:hypothetical protein CVAR292_02392 [Corynebacterium variabile]|uniref:Uncharacterized protein n=1 Tax=Corynebacterium variabile TaxID=1727 RepID=A0A0X2NQ86_9CORY|nr:hypothetical protein CVAR292_02392 [Corynebacterium variabile]
MEDHFQMLLQAFGHFQKFLPRPAAVRIFSGQESIEFFPYYNCSGISGQEFFDTSVKILVVRKVNHPIIDFFYEVQVQSESAKTFGAFFSRINN